MFWIRDRRTLPHCQMGKTFCTCRRIWLVLNDRWDNLAAEFVWKEEKNRKCVFQKKRRKCVQSEWMKCVFGVSLCAHARRTTSSQLAHTCITVIAHKNFIIKYSVPGANSILHHSIEIVHWWWRSGFKRRATHHRWAPPNPSWPPVYYTVLLLPVANGFVGRTAGQPALGVALAPIMP